MCYWDGASSLVLPCGCVCSWVTDLAASLPCLVLDRLKLMPVLLSFVLSPGHRWFPSTADASHMGLESKCPRGCPAPAGEPGLGKLGACTSGAQFLARWFQLQNHAGNQKRVWGSQEGFCHLVVKRTGKYLVRNPSTVFFQTGCLFSSFSLTISAAVFHCCSWCAMQRWSSTFSLTFGLCGIFSFFNNPIYFATRDFPMSLYAIILDTKNIGQIFVQSP